MKRFVDTLDVQRIDLGDNDWVEIPSAISFGQIATFGDITGSDSEKSVKMLSAFIKGWNLKEADGSDAPVNTENIRRLRVEDAKRIMEAIVPLTGAEKKA